MPVARLMSRMEVPSNPFSANIRAECSRIWRNFSSWWVVNDLESRAIDESCQIGLSKSTKRRLET